MMSSTRLCSSVSCTRSTTAAERGTSTGFPINLMGIIREKAYKKSSCLKMKNECVQIFIDQRAQAAFCKKFSNVIFRWCVSKDNLFTLNQLKKKKKWLDGFLLVTRCINRSGRWKRHLSPLRSVSVFQVFTITERAHVKQPTVSRGYSKLRGRTVHRDLDIHASVRSVGAGGRLWSVSLPLSLPLPALSLFTFICTHGPCCVSDARRLKRQTRFLWRTPRFLFNSCCCNSLRGPRVCLFIAAVPNVFVSCQNILPLRHRIKLNAQDSENSNWVYTTCTHCWWLISSKWRYHSTMKHFTLLLFYNYCPKAVTVSWWTPS